MALSREEIEQIGKTTAQEVIKSLHRYPLVYHDPETVDQGIAQSEAEELTVANWYRQRMKHAFSQGDETTAKLYEHIADEEDKHFKEFQERLHTLAVRAEMLHEAESRR